MEYGSEGEEDRNISRYHMVRQGESGVSLNPQNEAQHLLLKTFQHA